MPSNIDISIVLATKDRSKLLDEMLESLKLAVAGVSYEIIVVEGGSTDNTLEILQNHGVTNIFDEKECLGEGRHSWPELYNFGFSKAKGKWAMYASDDMVFGENCLTNALSLLSESPENVAGGAFFYKNVCAELNWDKYGIDFTYGQKLLLNYGLFRLDNFKEVGGLDETYKFYCADGDLCFKFYEQNKTLIPLPGSFVVHNNVLDAQKKVNFAIADKDIQLYKDRWAHFVDISKIQPLRLIWQEDKKDAYLLGKEKGAYPRIDEFWQALALVAFSNNSAAIKIFEDLLVSDKNFPKAKRLLRKIKLREKAIADTADNLSNKKNSISQLEDLRLIGKDKQVKLHLGCGQKHFDGYINIDFPPSEHSVQTTVAADVFADITQLNFPDNSVDEVRLHHVFEHFDTATALALICRWSKWLRKFGVLRIETPDFEKSLELYMSEESSYQDKQVILRHLFGSHEAHWAVHKDAWCQEKFEKVLTSLGFAIETVDFGQWKMTSNITVIAKKLKSFPDTEYQSKSMDLLKNSLVDASEDALLKIWESKFKEQFLSKYEAELIPVSEYCGKLSSKFSYSADLPLVSIFMPVYNGEKYIAATIESILEQTYSNFELIIADDGSEDNTLDIVRRYEKTDSRVKVIAMPHRGEVITRNEAIKSCNSKSKYLLNHDSDDLSLPMKLEALVKCLEENPEIAIVGCDATYFNDRKETMGKPQIAYNSEDIRKTFDQVNSMINSAALIRREVFERIGVYREEYRSVDDYDFYSRAIIAGFKCANLNTVLHLIRRHDKSVSVLQADKQRELEKSIQDRYRKHKELTFIAPNPLVRDSLASVEIPKEKIEGKRLKLHIGCGDIKVKNFINVDIDKNLRAVDVVDDVRSLSRFEANSAYKIYACHVLEHLSHGEVLSILMRWYDVLQPGAELRISVPDIDKIVKVYTKHWEHFQTIPNTPWIGLIYGGELDEFDYHKTGFNFTYLSYLLEMAGFVNVKEYSHEPHWLDIKDASLANWDGDYLSLNILAKKPR